MGIDARLLVRIQGDVDAEQVNKWANAMYDTFGTDQFMIDYKNRVHALTRVDEYTQDGESIMPQPGESLLKVRLFTRWYYVGLERGDLPFILSLAKWLEDKTGGKVWYGGDSSGVLAEPLDEALRKKLWDHFVENGHAPYWRNDVNKVSALIFGNPTCPLCKLPMPQWSKVTYTCACGYIAYKEDGEVTFKTPHEMKGGLNGLA